MINNKINLTTKKEIEQAKRNINKLLVDYGRSITPNKQGKISKTKKNKKILILKKFKNYGLNDFQIKAIIQKVEKTVKGLNND